MDIIGRDAELIELTDRLSERRLVTLVGPGGIGKTALAHAGAAALGGRYELGVRVIDLTRIDEPDDVPGAIAGQLGFPSFDALVDSPAEPSVLLIVDNCEHVVDRVADAVDELVEACQAPTVLATSRVPLDVPGEAIMTVGPLGLPRGDVPDPDNPCLRLLATRARDAGVAARHDVASLAALARRLDGVPLALEIAAARLRSLSPEEVLRLLDTRLDVLDRPRYRGATRHRGVRATIDWSYRLLSTDEQQLFDRLGVLAGPFPATMAHAVCGADGDSQLSGDRAATLDLLDALVSSSLLTADTSVAPTRYRMLEAVRAFARERLEPTVVDELHDRLLTHVGDQLVAVLLRSSEAWDGDIIGELLGLYEHAVTALRYALAHDDSGERAHVIVAVLWGVVHQSHTAEIGELGAEVLARWPDEVGGFRADAIATVATCRYLLGDPDGAIELAATGLALAERSSYAEVTLRRVTAQATQALGDTEAALAIFREGAARAADSGLLGLQLELEADVAQLMAALGDTDGGVALARDVANRSIALGSDITTLWARTVEANALRARSIDEAGVVAEETYRRCIEVGYPAALIINLRTMALVELARGDLARAATLTRRALDELVVRGSLNELRLVMEPTFGLVAAAGRTTRLDDLRATWRNLPVVSMIAAAERIPAGGDGVVLERSEVIRLARLELAAIAAADSGAVVGGDQPAGSDQPDAPEQPAAGPMEERPADDGDGARFVALGDAWELAFEGRVVQLRASKGLTDLARLLGEPGREVHALDLAGAAAEQSSTGPALDDGARRAYEDRARELHAEVEEAEAMADVGRAEKARTELDALVDQLTSAFGLGGRARSSGDTAERARSAVTQRIRSAIRRIGSLHPELGQHLRNSVRTGHFCSYEPDRDIAWVVRPG
ncbi:MAG: hypothetical protein S0880_10030 [Actinomycetota bacterium]|nr:hypothetical protein [Actinomycetota bacterium]